MHSFISLTISSLLWQFRGVKENWKARGFWVIEKFHPFPFMKVKIAFRGIILCLKLITQVTSLTKISKSSFLNYSLTFKIALLWQMYCFEWVWHSIRSPCDRASSLRSKLRRWTHLIDFLKVQEWHKDLLASIESRKIDNFCTFGCWRVTLKLP